MDTTNIGVYHLSDNPQLYAPQFTNNFEFIVTDIDNILRAGAIGTEEKARIPNAQEVIRLSVVSCPIPHFEQNVIRLRRGNNEMTFAGVATFSSGNIVVNDFVGADTKSVLMAWQNLSYDVKNQLVASVDVTNYKKDCYLVEYTPDYRKVRTFVLKGCWINSISESDHDNTNNEIHKITASITYDYAYVDTSELE